MGRRRTRALWTEKYSTGSSSSTTPSTGLRESRSSAANILRAAERQRGSKLEYLLGQQLGLLGLTPEREFRFHPTRRWRLDFAFPAVQLGVEVNGGIFAQVDANGQLDAGRHTRGRGQLNDMEKCNAAIELGWRVLVYGAPHIRSGVAGLQIERIYRALYELLEQQEPR